MWFIGVEVEQETSVPRPKKNPGSAPEGDSITGFLPGERTPKGRSSLDKTRQ